VDMNQRLFGIAIKVIGGNWRDKHGKWASTGFKGRVNSLKQWLRYQAANRRYTK
jgi:hypothetical protein